MTCGVRPCIVTREQYTGKAIRNKFTSLKNVSPLLQVFLLLLLQRISFVFLCLNIHILMAKEPSISTNQPLHKQHTVLFASERNALKQAGRPDRTSDATHLEAPHHAQSPSHHLVEGTALSWPERCPCHIEEVQIQLHKGRDLPFGYVIDLWVRRATC